MESLLNNIPYSHYLLNGEKNLILELAIICLNKSMEEGNSCLSIDRFVKENALNLDDVFLSFAQSRFVTEVDFNIEVANIPNIPLILVKFKDIYLLYINRYFLYEKKIARNIDLLSLSNSLLNKDLDKINFVKDTLLNLSTTSNLPNHEQLNSILLSLTRKFNIITGGPGTGKTTSVVFLLWAFLQMYGSNILLNICAPTGKAAKKIRESLLFNINSLSDITSLEVDNISQLINKLNTFGTIHKILTYQFNNIYFKHNSSNPLNVDILIVDESSMIGLPVFYKLLEAINVNRIKHIIFLGDSNQLSSVEEGYVFSSLVDNVNNNQYLCELKISNRNKGDIARFANAILNNNIEEVNEIVKTSSTIKLMPPSLYSIINSSVDINSNFIKLVDYANNFDQSSQQQLFDLLTDSAILCMTNVGNLGTLSLNYHIESRIKNIYNFHGVWYPGRIIIILQNDTSEKDTSMKLYNGDIGICVMQNNKPRIYFDEGRSYIPERLPKHELAFAISIHKSQGSEYRNVSIVIPDHYSQLLRKELVYTAITRTKNTVSIYSHLQTLIKAINIDDKRTSGLKHLLEN